MNICFLADQNSLYFNKIHNLLSKRNYVFICDDKDFLSKNNFSLLKEKEIDLVINFLEFLFDDLSDFCYKNTIPLFQITEDIYFTQQEYRKLTYLNHFILFSCEGEFLPEVLGDNNFVHVFPPIYSDIGDHLKEKVNSENFKVVICIEHSNLKFSPIYQLIPFLNLLTNSHISIIDSTLCGNNIFNNHIHLFDNDRHNMERLVSEADLIIGSGKIIYNGISEGKPCIVIGERGYGGIVEPQILSKLYNNYFQGRIGGNFDEYIPIQLLENDLKNISSFSEETKIKFLSENIDFLKKEQNNHLNSLCNFLERKVEQCNLYKHDFLNLTLVMSNSFDLIVFPNEKFVVINRFSKRAHSHVGKDEAKIINLFKIKNTVNKVMDTSGFDDKEAFIEFIKVLINEKILVFA